MMHFHIVDFHIDFHSKMSKVDIDTCSSNMSSIDFLYIMNKIDGNQWKILGRISKSEHVKLVLPKRYRPCRGRPGQATD